jgi:hypothetical protein
VDLIGGYKVNGNKAKRTKAKCCATILDGNLGTDVNPDYVWHVLMAGNDLTHHGISCNLINLTIQNANASQAPYFPINYFLNPGQIPIYYHDDGAGLYVVCRSQINICHVTMQHLNAIAGGALYADDGSIINIIKSKFIQNIGIDGGAIQIRSGGQNDLTDFAKRTTACFIDRCKFCDNQGVQGSVGGYDNYGIDINTGGPNLKIVDSEFYDRTPFGTIASITTQLELINCLFDHQGREGIGVWIFFVTNNRFKGCTFKNFYNSLDFPGAAISVTAPLMNYNYLEISNCSFENNITIDQLGGAISLRAIFPGLPIYARIENNEFIHNKSTIAGGAIYLDQGAIILNNNWPANRFKGNDAPIEKNIFAEQGVYLPPPFCCKDP